MSQDFKSKTLNYWKEFEIPIWARKKIQFSFYTLDGKDHRYLRLTIWLLHQLKELKEYEDEWFTNKWKHFTLFRWKIRK